MRLIESAKIVARVGKMAKSDPNGPMVGKFHEMVRRDPCSYCSGPGGTLDHIVPRCRTSRLADKGMNSAGACQGCNADKSDLSLLDYLIIRKARRERAIVDQQEKG